MYCGSVGTGGEYAGVLTLWRPCILNHDTPQGPIYIAFELQKCRAQSDRGLEHKSVNVDLSPTEASLSDQFV
jgi:hypothetical protein